MRLFAIFDIDHPMVAWEVAIGRILANPPKDEQGVEFTAPSLWLYNNIQSSINDKYISDLASEFHIEKFRTLNFPDKPSRLRGAFFFESKIDAIKACERWEWENKVDYISEVNFHESSYVKLDSNWITLRIRSCEKSERDSFIERYYSGAELFPSDPLNEIICTGYGEVLNSKLRRMAYRKILQQNPDASLLLALGISCFEQDSKFFQDIFRVTPFIRRIDNEVEGSFIINLIHLENYEEQISKIATKYIHNKGSTLITPKLNKPGIPLPIKRPVNPDTFFSLADLTPHTFKMNVEDFLKMSE